MFVEWINEQLKEVDKDSSDSKFIVLSTES